MVEQREKKVVFWWSVCSEFGGHFKLKVYSQFYLFLVKIVSIDKIIALKPNNLRSKVSNVLKTDLFILLHLNGGANTGSGVQCYVLQYTGGKWK